MSTSLVTLPLTAEQQGRIIGVLSLGCDRETAANFVGCSRADIGHAMRRDRAFAAAVLRTEAAAELSHMRAVHEAAKDVKNWKASVWWLERRAPERFAGRAAGTVTTRQLRKFLTIVAEALNSEIRGAEDRDRVLARLQKLESLAEDLVNDLWPTASTYETLSEESITAAVDVDEVVDDASE